MGRWGGTNRTGCEELEEIRQGFIPHNAGPGPYLRNGMGPAVETSKPCAPVTNAWRLVGDRPCRTHRECCDCLPVRQHAVARSMTE